MKRLSIRNRFAGVLTLAMGVAAIGLAQTPGYTTIDYPGATSTSAWGINNRGDVVGVYSLPDRTAHGFLWRGGLLTTIDFPGATSTDAWGINGRGDIVGDYTVDGVTHSFVLTEGRFVTVEVPGATLTSLAGINLGNELAGVYNSTDKSSHTVMIKGQLTINCDYPGGAITQGNGVNDAGDLVGNYTMAGVTHGFLRSKGQFTSFDFPNAAFTGAYGISNAGDIVGRYRDAAGDTHGYVYSGGKFTNIDIPGATQTAVSAINSVGDFVGRYTSGGVSHAFVMNAPAVSYTVTDLGTLPGGSFSQASQGTTDNGLIAGVSDVPGGKQHGVLWQFGQIIDLAVRGLGGPNSFAIGLNNRGAAVGQAETSEPDMEDFCLYGTGLRCAPFLWQNGIMNQLPTLGGPNGGISAINNTGISAGVAQTATRDASCPAPIFHQYEAAVWGPSRGQVRALRPLPGDTVGIAFWINDRGQVVGTSGRCDNTLPYGIIVGPQAVLWDSDGTPTDLGNLGGSVDVKLPGVGNRGIYISNNGLVVGASTLAGNKTVHAFLWTQDAGMKDLGVLPGDFGSAALAVNNRGEVVGASNDAEFNLRAFIWRNGVMTDLNTLVPADSPLYLLFASGINDKGEIVGFGATQAGDIHAFLAIPTNGAAASTALGVERPDALSETVRKAFPRLNGQRIPFGYR
jgi:probable HAF family extracellular repeat protein